jgi:hypothetical protein
MQRPFFPRLQDEKTMKINGMLKFHGDCGFGAPGKGRKALVVAKEPRVVARSCPEVFALRLRTCPAAGGSTAVMTFYMKVDESSLRAATGIKPNPKLRRGQWETVTVRLAKPNKKEIKKKKERKRRKKNMSKFANKQTS